MPDSAKLLFAGRASRALGRESASPHLTRCVLAPGRKKPSELVRADGQLLLLAWIAKPKNTGHNKEVFLKGEAAALPNYHGYPSSQAPGAACHLIFSFPTSPVFYLSGYRLSPPAAAPNMSQKRREEVSSPVRVGSRERRVRGRCHALRGNDRLALSHGAPCHHALRVFCCIFNLYGTQH
ncbi:hypothetical protein SKAU_G00045860 [Synaphobranchus kaupii]|uniref:Uncharacterized protein n=1 Tax=Synaphobranchus kaupii TaxID=118154 RepID=A0A9Q1G2F7_SYNKA|nr:hypothetical protein SKAU_G00045860 [Synaphobranchus kaupii]